MNWIDEKSKKYKEDLEKDAEIEELIKSKIESFNEQIKTIATLASRIPPPETVSYGTKYEVYYHNQRNRMGYRHKDNSYTFEFFTTEPKVVEIIKKNWFRKSVKIGIVNTLTIRYHLLKSNYTFFFLNRFFEFNRDDKDYTYENNSLANKKNRKIEKKIDLPATTVLQDLNWEKILAWLSFFNSDFNKIEQSFKSD